MRRSQRFGYPMGVDGVVWLSQRVAPFLAPRFYNPIISALWRRDWFSLSHPPTLPLFLLRDGPLN
jgi:hypothetical protein